MFGFGKKKNVQDEETGCAYCVYGAEEDGRLICQKKKNAKDPEKGCASYEYDLLKHRPGKAPRFAGWEPVKDEIPEDKGEN